MNPEIVREERIKGEPIYFGDATRERVLRHAEIEKASVVAVVVNDPIASLRIVQHARSLNASVHIIVRTHYLEEVQSLFQMGADEVIPDELGSSIEIFTQVLMRYGVPEDQIDQLVSAFRSEGYRTLRSSFADVTIFSDVKNYLEDVGIKKFTVNEGAPLCNQTVGELNIRMVYGVTILVVKRGQETIYTVGPETVLQKGDSVVVIGTKEQLANFGKLFHS